MSRKIFLRAAKICAAIFLAYVVLFGVISYLDFYIKYSETPRYPLGSYYSVRFYYALFLLPLAAGYYLLGNKSREERVLLASNFMVTAFVLLLILWLLYSIFHTLYKPFAYQPESIKLIDKFLEFIFFSSLGYFLYAPLFFSLSMLKRRLFVILLPVVLLLMIKGVEGMRLILSIAERLPSFLAIVLVLILFTPISEPPLPLAGVGLAYNMYLAWRWAEISSTQMQGG
jgi:hypothetical protein